MSKRAEEYARGLATLIQCPTVSYRGQTDKSCFYALQEQLRKLFPTLFSVCRYEDHDGSLLLCWQGRDRHALPILLMNHHDVVEATGAWRYPPFSGTVAEGKVWGRGTLDTKGGLWAMLQAAEELAAEGFVPPQDVWFYSGCNEETTGEGAQAVAKSLKERGIRFAFVLDEGGMILEEPIGGAKGQYAMIGVGEKGCAELRFVARSNGGHASTPGKNTPLVRLGKFMAAAEKKKLFCRKLTPTVQATLRSLSATMKGPLKLILGHPRLFAPLLVRVMPSVSAAAGAMLQTTVAFTMAGGSEGGNVLPQEAFVVGNMRYSHHQGGADSIAAIMELASKYGLETQVTEAGVDSPLSDYRGEAFAKVSRAVTKNYPHVRVAPYVMNAASDSRFMGELSESCFRFAPFCISDAQLESVHGIDENVDVSTLESAVAFYRDLLKGEKE